MRIFYAGQVSPQPSSTSSNIWEINIGSTLKKYHEVLTPHNFINVFDVPDNPRFETETFRRENSYALLREIEIAHKEKKIDLFFSYFYSKNILPEVITKIRELGIPTANIYFNSVHQFNLVKDIAPFFDYALFPEKGVANKYKEIGANPIRFPMAANPDFYRKFEEKKDYDVVFIGSDYLNRRDYVTFLFKHGVDVHVFGANWLQKDPKEESTSDEVKNSSLLKKIGSAFTLFKKGEFHELFWLLEKTLLQLFLKIRARLSIFETVSIPETNIHPQLSDQEMVMFSRAKIVLNLSETFLFDAHERGGVRNIVKLRDFEVPMCGGFAITGCQDELHDYYNVGSEIACYKNKRDLLKKVRYYLAHDEERYAMSNRAYERAQRDHTWKNRFDDFFKEIGLIQ